jgi:hypothetical protein
MTARMMPAETMCCAKGCGKLGEFHLGAKVWASSDPERAHGALELETTMVVCDDHRVNPPSTVAEFFQPESRERITQAMLSTGRAVPNYDGAEWVFVLIATPDQKAAN